MENKSSTILPINVDALHALLKEPQFKQIQIEAKDKKLGLFLGLTGAGKSTCISYLLGGALQKVRGTGGRSQVILSPTQNEVSAKKYPTIGMNDYRSETLHCDVFCDPLVDIAYCDTAGFMDTRTIGSAKEICASFSVQLAVESAACVAAIFIVVEWNIFNTKTCSELQNLLDLLSHFLMAPESQANSIFFLINKIPPDVTPQNFYYLVSTYKSFLLDTQAEYQDIRVNPRRTPPPQSLEDAIRMVDLFDVQIKKRPEQVIFMDLLDNGETRETIHTLLRKKSSVVPRETFNFRQYNPKRTLFEHNLETILPQLQAKDELAHKKAEAARVAETLLPENPPEILLNPLPENEHERVIDLGTYPETTPCVAAQKIANGILLSTGNELSIKSASLTGQNPAKDDVTAMLVKLVETAGPALLVKDYKTHTPEADNKPALESVSSTEPLKESTTSVFRSLEIPPSETTLSYLLPRLCCQMLGLGFGMLALFLLIMSIGLFAHEPFFTTLAQALFTTTVEPTLGVQGLTGMFLSLIGAAIFFSVATLFTQDSSHEPLTVEDGLHGNTPLLASSEPHHHQDKSPSFSWQPAKNATQKPAMNPTPPIYQTRILGKNL